MKKLQTPFTREDARTLKAGDACLISGVIYTARDASLGLRVTKLSMLSI